jgi:small subunit ribosomal protein S24e
VDVIHPNRPNVPKTELAELLAKKYKADVACVVLTGFRTAYGGGKSTGFCLIYENATELGKFEPNYRKARLGLMAKKETSRKQIKEAKNRGLKIRGTGKRIQRRAAKKAASG